jgi:hypothetical protein
MNIRRLHHGRPVSNPMTIPAPRDATPAALRANLTAPAAIHPEVTASALARAHPIAFDFLAEPCRLPRSAPSHTLDLISIAPADARNLIRAIFALIARIFNEAGAELARLNRIGLRDDALAGKSRRERARTVADALSRRHAGHRRCC